MSFYEQRLVRKDLGKVVDVVTPRGEYTLYPEHRFGQGGQGVICLADHCENGTFTTYAGKLPDRGAIAASDLLPWLNGMFGLNLTVETINSVNLLPYFAHYLLQHKTFKVSKNTYSRMMIEGFSGYMANYLLDHHPDFNNCQRLVLTAKDLVFLHQVLDNGELVFFPILILPLLPNDFQPLGEVVEEMANMRDRYSAINLAADLIEQLANIYEQLEVAHAGGVVHRDIKFDNIVFVNGVLQLLDFGFALVHDYTMNTTGGTLGYVAPDALRSEGWTADSDQFSMFALIARLLLQLLGEEKPVFLKRQVEKWSFSKIFEHGETGKPELLISFKQMLTLGFSFASNDLIMHLHDLIAVGLETKPSQRHKHPVIALHTMAKILRQIAQAVPAQQGN
jgi:serine/threonine protein kinase